MISRISSVHSVPAVRKGLIAAAAVVVAYTLFGFFGVPAILSSILPKMLSEELLRKVSIREIRFHPYELSLSVRGLEISEREGKGTWISAEEAYANLQLASIVRGGPVLSEVRLLRPYVNVVRHADGRYNFMDLIEKYSKKPAKESKPLKFSLNNIQLIDGRIDFDDGPKKTRHEVRGIHLSLPFLSNLPYYVDRYIQPSFAAVVNGKRFSVKGRTKPFSDTLETVFDIDVADLDIPHYLEYVPVRREYGVPSAFLDVKGAVSFSRPKGKPPVVRVEGDLVLRRLRIVEKGSAPMVHLPTTRVTILPSDVVAGELRVSRLEVTAPEIDAGIDRNGILNLLVLSPRNDNDIGRSEESGTSVASAATESPSMKVSVESVRVSGGKVRFTDASRHAPFRTSLADLRIDVDRLSTEKGKAADALLSVRTEAGETFEWKGNLVLSPFASEGTVSMEKWALKKYEPYYGGAVRFDVLGGTLGLRSGYRIARKEGGTEILLSGLSAGLADLRLKRREDPEEFLKIPQLAVKDVAIDLGKREVDIAEAVTARGSVSVRRGPGGELNLAGLLADKKPASAASGSGPAAKFSGRDVPAEKPWAVTVKKAAIDRFAVRFLDASTEPPVALEIEPIRLHLENVSTRRNRRGKVTFSATIAREGTVSVSGPFSIEPPSLRAKVELRSLPIRPAQPYFTDKVKILVAAGSVSAAGELAVDVPAGKPPAIVYKGEASVNGLSSLDKDREEEFLKFAALHFGGVEVGYNPTRLVLREISMTDFYSRIIVNPDGTLNVQGIVAKGGGGREHAPRDPAAEDSARADNAAQAAGVPVRIDAVTLQGGTVNFSDRYVKPGYSASLVEIGGRVSGLSSEEGRLADIDLRGKLENSAPLEIVGKINPLAKDLFLDLKVDFRDMDLSPLSPYSGRYAGYGIRKGKLTLNLKYHIEKRKLESENKVFLDQFTFGDSVESPEATKLPVRLAVALLKDRSGEIRLDLPVTGSIDDPKFSIWGVVWKIVVNLLAKAATSPFALLGAVFGGGEQLSYLEFPPGSADIPAGEDGKIGTLAKALNDRPALKLEIEGHVDPEKDREAVRQLLFRRKVAARKLSDLGKAGKPAPPLDAVRVEPAEYPKYLVQAYKAEKFPKPRNFLGIAKDLPAAEMEKLMLTHIQVSDDDLRRLAADRASHVRDRIVGIGKVEAERVFLVSPKALPPERKEKKKDSRVDFRLR